MSQKQLPTRQELNVEETWDTSTIFETEELFEEQFKEVENRIPELTKYQGRLAESADTLFEALELRNEIYQKYSHLAVYAHLQSDVDTANSHYQGMQSKVNDLGSKVMASMSYFTPEIMEADESIFVEYLKDDRLKEYEHEFELLFRNRPHILSATEEALLAKASPVLGASSRTFSILNNADLKFPTIKDEKGEEVQLSHGRYSTFMESKDRQVRHDAFKAMYKTYGDLQNTFASTLSTTVKAHNMSADIRGFDSARHHALFNNTIDESVFDALLEAVHDRLELLHRYVKLRKEALKLDEVRMYDMYVPMVDDVDLKFTWEEAKDVTLEALKVLGDDYLEILNKAFNDRWIDIHENQGKRSGAYSSGTYGTIPFILLNWQGNLDDVYTLVHELGHSVHSYYTRNNQPFIYGDYSIFLAEVASTTNEHLLTHYLLNKYDDPKVKAYIINHFLDGVKGTVYRQTQFAEFEHLIHQSDQEGTALTSEYLNKSYFDLNKKYYGDGVIYDDEIKLEWARIPHFYYNYYVYQYATGFSAATAFSKYILENKEGAVEKYINYLKAGSSDYPMNVLKDAGVDMSTNQATIDALNVFEQRLNELEEILK